MRKNLLLLFISFFVTAFAFAQVTTSSIVGTIKDAKGQPLPGATVVATNVPTGTVYSSAARSNGQFTIPNMQVGGPYTVKISFIGFNMVTYNNLNLSLGTPLSIDATLIEEGKTLAEVNVTSAKKGSVISPEHTGASTNVSLQQLQNLPTVSRNIQDFARLTPQALSYNSSSDGSPMGISFAGQSNKYNMFTIDGAAANDVFGLTATGTNGGQSGANPISLESIQELQIVLSPYDVTQSGFTGGGINAVTKSGTNTFHGSAYDYFSNQNFVGKSPSTGLKYQNFKNQTFGFSLGGPIVKNKLFFFANYERINNSTPLAYDPTQAGSGSNFDVTTLENLRNYLTTTYKFDPGSYGSINKGQTSDYAFARLDWNINSKNRLTIRHSYTDGASDIISRSANSITFANSGYKFNTKSNSTVLELNSTFSNNASNIFRLTYNAVRDYRTTAAFPTVYILDGSLGYNFGGDGSSVKNSLDQNDFTLTDNFTLYKNNHTLTFGTDNYFYNTNNVFIQYYYGYYNRYTSVAAFEANTTAPNNYSAYYSVAGGNDVAPQIMHAAQLGIYGQDVWSIKNNFKLTYGLRIDLPVYFNKPANNAAFNSSAIAIANNAYTNITPKSTPLFAPRAGFNWDVKGDATTQLRGGVGLFTGRVPFVWLSNQYGGTGATIIKYSATGAALSGIRFNYDPNDPHLGATLGSSTAASEIDVTDHNFKFTQTLRSNLALDQKLPWGGLIATLEGIYTKKINDILYKDLNLTATPTTVTLGSTTRPYYNYTRATTAYTNVLYLTNTSQGYAYNLTFQIQKPTSRTGWSGMIAYTFGHSTSLNDGTSSTAASNWRFAYNTNGANNLDLSRSNYDPGSRIIGYISKRFSYAHNRASTTVGVVYTGQSGQPFSYLYGSNVIGDDVTSKSSAANLAYLPSTLAQAQLVQLTKGSTIVTPAQQFADFQDFESNQKYLKDHSGQTTTRNADRMPWENHFDLKLSEEVAVYKQHKLSISADVLNVGNLLDKNWGRAYYLGNQSVNLFTVVSQTANPTFNFDKTKFTTVNGVVRPYGYSDYLSRWRGQLSVRYSF